MGEFDNILIVGPIAGKKHQQLLFPVVAPDPDKDPDVKYLTYPFYAGGNRGRGQVYTTGEKGNFEIKIVNSEGVTTSQTLSAGLQLLVKQGDIVKVDQPLNIDPNVG